MSVTNDERLLTWRQTLFGVFYFFFVYPLDIVWLPLVVIALTLPAGGLWLALAWLATAWLLWLGGGFVYAAEFWREWAPWRPRPPLSRLSRILTHGVVVLTLTAVFTAVTADLYERGLLTTEPPVDDQLVLTVFAYYAWSLLDAVPVLEIPDTLNWSRPANFTDIPSGMLLLAYKLLVIIPVVGVIRDILRAEDGAGEANSSTPTGQQTASP